MHHKTFSDNTLEEKDDWLFPDKVAILLVSIKNKGKEDNRETDRIKRRCIMKINYLTGTVTFDWDGEHANWGGEAKPKFSNRDIGILNFEKHFPNLIADTMN